MKRNVVVNEELKVKVLNDYKQGSLNKSECIRMLFDNGLEVKEISKEMNIIYNMVYNIVSKYILRNNLEDEIVKESKKSFSDELIEYVKDNKGIKKSEVVKYFIKNGRGEGYIYSNIKKLVNEGKLKF